VSQGKSFLRHGTSVLSASPAMATERGHDEPMSLNIKH